MKMKKQIYSTIRKILRIWCKHTVKVNPRIIVFSSYVDYSDNSRALSDYLLQNGYAEKYDIYWKVNDAKRCRALHPNDKVHFFEDKNNISFKAMKLFYSAAWQFATHNMMYYDDKHPQNKHYILLWHGCSYKDKDSELKKDNDFRLPCDKVLVAGPMFIETKSKFWNIGEDKIISLGYPRYDWLLNGGQAAKVLYKSLLRQNNKIVIWMPTFRNDKRGINAESSTISHFPLLEDEKHWHELDQICKKRRIILLIKLHPFQKDYPIKWETFSNVKKIENEDFENSNTTMYSFLSMTDGLITDYSSIAIDYLVVDKPIAFTLDDYKLYKDGRGFIVPNVLEYMPGHHLYNIRDLNNFLNDIADNSDPYKNQRLSMKGTLVNDSICYCKDIIEEINL